MAKELKFNSWQEQEILFSTASQPPLGPTQTCIQQVLASPSPGIKWQSMKLTAFHLMPRLRLVELYLHSPIHLYGMVLNEEPFLQCLMDQYSESAKSKQINISKNTLCTLGDSGQFHSTTYMLLRNMNVKIWHL
jgi:hypothetical protein